MNIIIIVLSVFLILCIGLLIIELLSLLGEYSIVEKLSFSWGLGFGVLAMQMFFYSILGIPWALYTILSPWVIVGVIFVARRKNKISLPRFKMKASKFEIMICALIMCLLLFVGIESILRPVQAWDGWDNWVLRAKVFYVNNNINRDYFTYTQDEYPILVPLVEVFGYMMEKRIDDRSILFLFYAFYLFLGALFYVSAKKSVGNRNALIFTFLLLSLQNLIRHGGRFEAGQADLPLAYYIFATSMLFLNYIKKMVPKNLVVLGIFLGICAQIKNDAIPFFICINILVFGSIVIYRKYSYIFPALIPIIFLAPWELYKLFYHLPRNFLFRSGINIDIGRVGIVLTSMTKEFINLQNWNLLWVVFIISIFVFCREIPKVRYLLVIIIFQWFSYFVIFLLTPTNPAEHVANVINKLYIHIAPLALFSLAIILNGDVNKSVKIFAGKSLLKLRRWKYQ